MNGGSFNEVDDINNIQDWINVYENTDIMKNMEASEMIIRSAN